MPPVTSDLNAQTRVNTVNKAVTWKLKGDNRFVKQYCKGQAIIACSNRTGTKVGHEKLMNGFIFGVISNKVQHRYMT